MKQGTILTVRISGIDWGSNMTVQEALDQRIEKIRLPVWAEGSYISFDFVESGYGPWAHVKDPSGETDMFVFMLLEEDKSDEWEEYKGDV